MDLALHFCPNKNCKDYGQRNRGNIALRAKYGKDKGRNLLYCRTCGKRFAASQSTAFFGMHLAPEQIQAIIHHAAEGVSVRATARLLGLDKNLVNRVILRAGEHCAAVLSLLLQSLNLTEVQLDELWAFVKKSKVVQKRMKTSSVKNGYGRPQMRSHGS